MNFILTTPGAPSSKGFVVLLFLRFEFDDEHE